MTFTPVLQYASDLNAAFDAETANLLTKQINPAVTYGAFPIGTILFWAKSLTGVPGSLPSGWQECDGTNGTPNLIGTTDATKRFVRGTTSTTGGTGGTTSHNHVILSATGYSRTGTNTGYPNTVSTENHAPSSSYQVVPIIKVS